MAYAHPRPGEHCTRCNHYAAHTVGTQPLCTNHFTKLINHCHHRTHQRILTPPHNLTPDAFTLWAEQLRHGINIGAITDQEAADAWNTARKHAT